MAPTDPKSYVKYKRDRPGQINDENSKAALGMNRVLRPVVSAVPLCPHADTTERLVRPVVSAVPLCPRWIFIVPLYPRADITERLVRPVMSAVPLCPQIILEIHYILNTHPLKLISIHGL